MNAKPASNAPQAIVIEPSRELAEQVGVPYPISPPDSRRWSGEC